MTATTETTDTDATDTFPIFHLEITDEHTLVLPDDLLRALGVAAGDAVAISVAGRQGFISKLAKQARPTVWGMKSRASAKGLLRDYFPDHESVERFLEERGGRSLSERRPPTNGGPSPAPGCSSGRWPPTRRQPVARFRLDSVLLIDFSAPRCPCVPDRTAPVASVGPGRRVGRHRSLSELVTRPAMRPRSGSYQCHRPSALLRLPNLSLVHVRSRLGRRHGPRSGRDEPAPARCRDRRDRATSQR